MSLEHCIVSKRKKCSKNDGKMSGRLRIQLAEALCQICDNWCISMKRGKSGREKEEGRKERVREGEGG